MTLHGVDLISMVFGVHSSQQLTQAAIKTLFAATLIDPAALTGAAERLEVAAGEGGMSKEDDVFKASQIIMYVRSTELQTITYTESNVMHCKQYLQIPEAAA